MRSSNVGAHCTAARHGHTRSCLHACAALNNPSALFRHDVCFCLGQRQEPGALDILAATLKDRNEHPM